jgi:hypothetical protein
MSKTTIPIKGSLSPIPEPAGVIRTVIAPLTAVTETRKIIPAGVAITETEQVTT